MGQTRLNQTKFLTFCYKILIHGKMTITSAATVLVIKHETTRFLFIERCGKVHWLPVCDKIQQYTDTVTQLKHLHNIYSVHINMTVTQYPLAAVMPVKHWMFPQQHCRAWIVHCRYLGIVQCEICNTNVQRRSLINTAVKELSAIYAGHHFC